jgi:hypothetical protein
MQITENTVNNVLDRSNNIDDVAKDLVSFWQMDIAQRKPSPALIDPTTGKVQPTDLDLLCLMSTLAARKAKVFIPDGYKSQSPTVTRGAGSQVVVSPTRMGPITSVGSNADFFAFSFTVNDLSVLDTATDAFGAYRTFHITGKDGRRHSMWSNGLNFVPDARENEFIKDFGLVGPDGALTVTNIVSPSRRLAFYRDEYWLTKLVIQRMSEEASALRAFVRSAAPKTSSGGTKYSGATTKEVTKEVQCPIMTVEMDAPFSGSFETPTDVAVAREDIKFFESALQDLRFAARATEYAFYKTLGERGPMPAWAASARFDDALVGRTNWRAMKGSTLAPKTMSDVTLRYRIRSKMEKVAA